LADKYYLKKGEDVEVWPVTEADIPTGGVVHANIIVMPYGKKYNTCNNEWCE
jgi:hypothetical protein